MSVSITLATALTGESTTSMVFRDAAEAETGAIKVAGSSAAAAAEQYQSAVRLQNMTGQVKCSGCCARLYMDQSPAAPMSCLVKSRGLAHLAALGLVSMMLRCVIVKTVKLSDPTEMRKSDSFGETRLVLHVPSSS